MKVPRQWQVGLILTIGVLAISTAAIFIRLAMAAAGSQGVVFSLFLAASRLSIASIILLPTWVNLRQIQVSRQAYYSAILAGVCLAFHVVAWITSLSFTSIVASTVLVTTTPIWVSLLSLIWFKEKLKELTFLAIIIAFGGGIIMAFGELKTQAGTNPLLGDSLALIGAWLASLYLLLGREAQRKGFSIGNYIVVAYTTAALVLLPLPFIFGKGYLGYPNSVYLYVLLMAIFSQLVGHTSFNWAMRWLSPTLVSLGILFEPVGASILGFVLFKEIPSTLVIEGGIVLLIGVAIAVIAQK